MNKYLGYFIVLLSSKAVRAGINILFIVLLGRIIGPNGLGEWAMVVAAGTLMHSLLLNWMHAPTVRFGREEWQGKGRIATTLSARLPYLLAGFIITASLVIFDPAQWLERYFHLSGILRYATLVASFWLWLSMETQNLLQLGQAMMRLSFLPVFIDGAPVIALAAVLISGGALPDHVLITGLLTLSVILWGIALCRELIHLRARWVRPGIEDILNTFYYAWPLIPGFLLGYVSDWGDQLLLRFFFTTHEVGLFQSAYQFMILLLGVAAPLGTIMLPLLIDKKKLSSDAAKKFFTDIGPTMITLGLFLMVPIVSFAPLCFQILMGNKFIEATPAFVVLCAAVPGSIIATFYGVFFSLQGRLWRSTVIYGGIMSILNITISLILLPSIGMMGSAVATSISYLVSQFLYMFDQHSYYGISLTKGLILFCAILTFSILQLLVGGGLPTRFILCLLSFTALVLLARAYSLLDREWVLRILSGRLSTLGELVVRISGPRYNDHKHA